MTARHLVTYILQDRVKQLLQEFAEDELVFREQPLVGAQHTANKAAALVCSHCFQFLGPLQDQISHCLPQLPGLEASGMIPTWCCGHKPLCEH